MQITHNIYKFFVIQAKTGKLIDMVNICDFVDHPVIAGTNPVHGPAFLACTLDSDDNLCSLFPFTDKFRNHVNRILKICCQTYHAVSICLFHSIYR